MPPTDDADVHELVRIAEEEGAARKNVEEMQRSYGEDAARGRAQGLFTHGMTGIGEVTGTLNDVGGMEELGGDTGPSSALDYSTALHLLKYEKKRMRRAGWNGKGMWIQYLDGTEWGLWWHVRPVDETTVYKTLPFILMKTADDGLVPWLCSNTDALADDWEVAE